MAARNGVITESEQQIIDSVSINLKIYEEALERAKMDSYISSAEHQNLEDLAKNIVKDAKILALADGIYQRYERDLILKLNKIIHKYIEI